MSFATFGIRTFAVAALSSVAYSSDFDLGTHLLAGGEAVETVIDLHAPIVFMTVSFEFDKPVNDASWASDVQFTITSIHDDSSFVVGGFTNAAIADVPWAFDGPGSSSPGFYTQTFDLVLPFGQYFLSFANDWFLDPNPNLYSNIQVSFVKFPTPGTVGLLGLAGVAAARRRR